MKRLTKIVLTTIAVVGVARTASAVTVECMDFESFPAGGVYVVGNNYSYNDIFGEFTGFMWPDGTWDTGGQATVVTTNMANGSGQEVNLNNINLRYVFQGDQPIIAVFRYADSGGNVNLGINGFLNNTNDLSDLNGMVVDGVGIVVTRQDDPGPAVRHRGIVTLAGPIERFAVGGQEFWVDDVCAVFAY